MQNTICGKETPQAIAQSTIGYTGRLEKQKNVVIAEALNVLSGQIYLVNINEPLPITRNYAENATPHLTDT